MIQLNLFNYQKEILEKNKEDKMFKDRQTPVPNISEAPLMTPITEKNIFSSSLNPK